MSNPLALVIEDDRDLAVIFATALEAAEFEVEMIHDGIMASERLAEIVPRVVLLDLNLPRVSGKSLLEQIRADKRLDKTHVVLATANHVLAEALRDDADMVLVKPIRFKQLRDLTRRLRTDTDSLDPSVLKEAP